MARQSKDAFLAPPAKPLEGEPAPVQERGTQEWGRRMFLDGVEVNPETMQPIDQKQEP